MQILIGADPECFVKVNGKFVSAYGLVEGTKLQPKKVRNGAVQVDGMALEFNIEPASTEEDFLYKIEDVLNQLKAMVHTYEVVAEPIAQFTKEYINRQPEDAKTLGCDPDYNAWTGEQNPIPDAKVAFRTGSGHIHIGWTEKENDIRHIMKAREAAKQCDFYLGLPSLLYDKDKKRKSLYGKAGAFRVKPYGVEYRTLSNAWLNDKNIAAMVFRNAQKGMKDLVTGNMLSRKYGDIQHIINDHKIEDAIKIMEEERIEYVI